MPRSRVTRLSKGTWPPGCGCTDGANGGHCAERAVWRKERVEVCRWSVMPPACLPRATLSGSVRSPSSLPVWQSHVDTKSKQGIGALHATDALSRRNAVGDAVHDAWTAAGPGLREL